MSFLQKVFKKKSKKPTLVEALKNLKATEASLSKQHTYLETKIKEEIANAKKNASTNRKAVQRKKRYERQLQYVDGALTALESQKEVLEEANTNSLAVDTMKTASKALKAAQKDFDSDKIEKMLEDLELQKDVNDDIADALKPFNDNGLDDMDLEKELNELNIDEVLPSVPLVPFEEKKEQKKEKKIAVKS